MVFLFTSIVLLSGGFVLFKLPTTGPLSCFQLSGCAMLAAGLMLFSVVMMCSTSKRSYVLFSVARKRPACGHSYVLFSVVRMRPTSGRSFDVFSCQDAPCLRLVFCCFQLSRCVLLARAYVLFSVVRMRSCRGRSYVLFSVVRMCSASGWSFGLFSVGRFSCDGSWFLYIIIMHCIVNVENHQYKLPEC